MFRNDEDVYFGEAGAVASYPFGLRVSCTRPEKPVVC